MQQFRTPQRTKQQQRDHRNHKEQHREQLRNSRKRQILCHAPIVTCLPIVLAPRPQSEARHDRKSLGERSGSEEHSETRFRARLDVSTIDRCFDPSLLRVLFCDAFGDWESTAGGRFYLGAAVTLPPPEFIFDPAQGAGGTIPGGCNERGFVFLGSSVSSAREWCRSSRGRCTRVLPAEKKERVLSDPTSVCRNLR